MAKQCSLLGFTIVGLSAIRACRKPLHLIRKGIKDYFCCSKNYSDEIIGTCQVSTLKDFKTSNAESITASILMLVNQLLSRKQPTNKSEQIQIIESKMKTAILCFGLLLILVVNFVQSNPVERRRPNSIAKIDTPRRVTRSGH